MRLKLIGVAIGWITAAACQWSAAQTFHERFEDWPLELTIHGRLVVAGQVETLQFLPQLLPDITQAPSCWAIDSGDSSTSPEEMLTGLFGDVQPQAVEHLAASLEAAPQWLAWHAEDDQLSQLPTDRLQQIAGYLARHLAAGKSVLVTGSAACVVGKIWGPDGLAGGEGKSVAAGVNLLPDCLLELDFSPDGTQRLLNCLDGQQRCVGLGREPQTLLLLEGRRLRVAGPGRLWMMLPAGAGWPSRVQTLAARESFRQPVTHWLADLTQWRRDAIDRTLEPFPPPAPEPPRVERGALVIVGGGGMPRGLMRRFVELAGGPEHARLVYIPCAEQPTVSNDSSVIPEWRQLGVRTVCQVHTKDRRQAEFDELFLEPLKEATGIWFGGGRQWNLADSYYGTQAHRLMKQVLQRGGVIGGSSAGASIQARYLARATPIENVLLMAPGYERGGLGFISGVAIDQHFSQRGRQADMPALIERYPQLLGIGIDEATALVVQGSQAEIVGRGRVFFYDAQHQHHSAEPYVSLVAGELFDLANRRRMETP